MINGPTNEFAAKIWLDEVTAARGRLRLPAADPASGPVPVPPRQCRLQLRIGSAHDNLMVDWTVALSTASSWSSPVPRSPARAPPRRWPTCATARSGPRRTYSRSPADRRRRHRAGAGGGPAALDRGEHRRLPADPAAAERQGRRRRLEPRRLVQHRRPDHRGRGRRAAQLSGAEGARPVRPVLPRRRRGRDPSRDCLPAAGCCWWPPTSSRSNASWTSARPTSGSGSACTRRPTGSSSPPCRGCATI